MEGPLQLVLRLFGLDPGQDPEQREREDREEGGDLDLDLGAVLDQGSETIARMAPAPAKPKRKTAAEKWPDAVLFRVETVLGDPAGTALYRVR